MYNYGQILSDWQNTGPNSTPVINQNLEDLTAKKKAEEERLRQLRLEEDVKGANAGGGLAGALLGGVEGFMTGGPMGAVIGAGAGGLGGLSKPKTGDTLMDVGGGGIQGLNTASTMSTALQKAQLAPFEQAKTGAEALKAYYEMYEPITFEGTPPSGALQVPSIFKQYYPSGYAMPRTEPFSKPSPFMQIYGGQSSGGGWLR